MREVRKNILSKDVLEAADVICVTTNGQIRRDGKAVMGAGIAKAFRDRFPKIDQSLAIQLNANGNHVNIIAKFNQYSGVLAIYSLPTKEHWRNPSPLALVLRSIQELRDIVNEKNYKDIWLPRPGCGYGGLNWSEVKPQIAPYLDNRFTICHL